MLARASTSERRAETARRRVVSNVATALRGEVVYLFAFDVADEIHTSKARQILKRCPEPYDLRFERAVPRTLPRYRPIAVELPPLVAVDGRPVRVEVRVYDVGVITLAFRAEFEAGSLSELAALHRPLLDGGATFEEEATKLCRHIYDDLVDVRVGGSPPAEPEAYVVYCVSDLGGRSNATDWLESEARSVAALLARVRPDELGEEQSSEALHIRRAFGPSDLVVMDWEAAFVVDLSGYYDDVLYVLELANLQLEEFRVMDARLDEHLNRAYDELGRSRGFPFSDTLRTLRSLRQLRVDVSKLADEVMHITKFVGDYYLARVYLGARERFHLEEWRASVERRLSQLDQLYSVAHTEAYERRMFWLEVMIVVMFALDLVILFVK